MNIQEAKTIKLADYLQSLGYSPVKQQGKSLWYKSPFREETEASFKINTELNQWYDFGTGNGGNIIALTQELYGSDYVPYLLGKIAEQAPHVRPGVFLFSSAGIRTEFPTFGGERTHSPCIAPLLAGAWNKHRIGTG